MALDYTLVRSITEKEFQDEVKGANKNIKFVQATADDISKMEKFLDVWPGTLSNLELLIEDKNCGCGKNLEFFDFVFTAVSDFGHSKSFVLHTLVGSKFIKSEARPFRCSACMAVNPDINHYETRVYGCCRL